MVNVTIENKPVGETAKDHAEKQEIIYPEVPNFQPSPYGVLPENQTAQEQNFQLLEQQLKDREDYCKALDLIIQIIESNPLIINKYIVPSTDNLANLIEYLSKSEQVEIVLEDDDINCCSFGPQNFFIIRAIYIHNNGSIYNFHHCCPEVIRLLESHRISTHICTMDLR